MPKFKVVISETWYGQVEYELNAPTYEDAIDKAQDLHGDHVTESLDDLVFEEYNVESVTLDEVPDDVKVRIK